MQVSMPPLSPQLGSDALAASCRLPATPLVLGTTTTKNQTHTSTSFKQYLQSNLQISLHKNRHTPFPTLDYFIHQTSLGTTYHFCSQERQRHFLTMSESDTKITHLVILSKSLSSALNYPSVLFLSTSSIILKKWFAGVMVALFKALV